MPKNDTLENAAYKKIKEAILTRKLLPGSKLSEPALAQQLNISRTPIRAAIRRLVTEGLAKSETNQGAHVVIPSLREIQEVLFMRETLEPVGARLAAANITDDDAVYLNSLIDSEQKAFDEKDLKTYIEVNDRFHLKIANLSGNGLLVQSISNFMTRYDVFLALFDPIYELRDEEMQSMLEHRLLVNSLAEQNGIAAECAMKYHLISSRKYTCSDIIEKKFEFSPVRPF